MITQIQQQCSLTSAPAAANPQTSPTRPIPSHLLHHQQRKTQHVFFIHIPLPSGKNSSWTTEYLSWGDAKLLSAVLVLPIPICRHPSLSLLNARAPHSDAMRNLPFIHQELCTFTYSQNEKLMLPQMRQLSKSGESPKTTTTKCTCPTFELKWLLCCSKWRQGHPPSSL